MASRPVYVICLKKYFLQGTNRKTKTQQMQVILQEGDLRALNLSLVRRYCLADVMKQLQDAFEQIKKGNLP